MISNGEALSALQDVETTRRRSREAYGYSLSAPYCFIWGVAWFVAYASEASGTPYVWWIWSAAISAGAIACVVVGLSQARRGAPSIRRIWLLFVVLYAFSFALFSIFSPVGPFQIAAYWPLLWAAVYCGIGLWLGMRYVIVGGVLGGLTLAAYFLFRDHFYITMAFAGGGSLILTGFWLR